MDKSKAANIAREYFDFVRQNNVNVKKGYIFGSVAKGTANEDSDIDLAIIFNELDDTFDMQVKLMKLRRRFDTRIEPHPFRASDFQTSNPLANEIMKTGVELPLPG
ncbi:MAG: nucleotidyltransferase [Deltaproteobacteria bacterium]|nr:MAG: nucleotidyltransferase [Deltaproteobacteria bacterium]